LDEHVIGGVGPLLRLGALGLDAFLLIINCD
jgi:hypothetical protein